MSSTYPEDGPAAQAGPEPEPTAGSLKAQARSATERVRGEARQFADSTRQKAVQAVETQQHKLTGTMGDFADAIRTAGDELTQRNQGFAAQLVRQAADGLEGVSRSLDNRTPGEMLDSVRDFGRRHPMAFIGGAALIGLAVGRFIRASAEPDYDADSYETAGGWDSDPMTEARAGDGLDANAASFDAAEADATMTPDGMGRSTVASPDDLDGAAEPTARS